MNKQDNTTDCIMELFIVDLNESTTTTVGVEA